MADFNWNAIPGLLGTIGGGLAVKEAYDRLGDIGDEAFQYDAQTGAFSGPTSAIADQANRANFQPYAITSNVGKANVSADGSTNLQLNQNQLGQQNMMGNYAQNMFTQSMQDNAAREASIYDQMRAMQRPGEQRAAMALENRLRSQGRGQVTTNQYGGTPEQLAQQKAIAEARNQAALMAMQQGQAEQMQQANIGSQYMQNQYMPQAALLNAMQPGIQNASLADVGRRQSAGLYADALMGGLETSLGARMGQANLMGNLGAGLISGALTPSENNPLMSLFKF